QFPKDIPAAIVVVIHLPVGFHSTLDAILTQAGPLKATFAQDLETMERGHIYIGPPATHLLLDGDGQRLRLGHGPRENNSRPAIDPLFRSVAVCCGARTIGAVLTGTLGDGASGLQALKTCGGVTVVQDPNDAAFSEMPAAALSKAHPDHVVGLKAIPALIDELVREPAGVPVPASADIKFE